MRQFQTKSEEETKQLASFLAEQLFPGSVVLLEGQLGAGKTTFTKGLAEGLGIKRIIKSPTYTLIREYTDGRLPLYHMDLYRLEETGAEDLGLDEYFEGDGISVVEWASLVPEEMPEERLNIRLTVTGEEGLERLIEISANGEAYKNVLEQLDEYTVQGEHSTDE